MSSKTVTITEDVANDLVRLIENRILFNTESNYRISGDTLADFKKNWKNIYGIPCPMYPIEVWKESNRLTKFADRLRKKFGTEIQ